jgi:hypothetical protein
MAYFSRRPELNRETPEEIYKREQYLSAKNKQRSMHSNKSPQTIDELRQ